MMQSSEGGQARECRDILVDSEQPSAAVHRLRRTLTDKQCWICLVSGGPDLIAPCSCTGSMRWVHRQCLDRWRVSAINPQNFTNCRHCNFQYQLVMRREAQDVSDLERRRRRRRFIGEALTHFALGALAIQGILCLVAMLIRAMDQKEVLVKVFNFTQVDDAPPPGEGTFWEAIKYHKSTYYFAAVLLALLLGGCLATVGFLAGLFRLEPDARRNACATCLRVQDPFCLVNCAHCCADGAFCTDCCVSCCQYDMTVCATCHGCSCDFLNCSACVAIDGEVCAAMFLGVVAVVALTFIFIGLFFAMMALVTWAQRTVQRYLQLRELRDLVGDYVVQDLSGGEGMDVVSCDDAAPSAPSAPPAIAEPPVQQGFEPEVSAPPMEPEIGTFEPRPHARDDMVARWLRRDLQAVYGLPDEEGFTEGFRRRAEAQASHEATQP